jgi:subtilisin family serine protease
MGSTTGLGPSDNLTRAKGEKSRVNCCQSASRTLSCCYNSSPTLASAADPGMEFNTSEGTPMPKHVRFFVSITLLAIASVAYSEPRAQERVIIKSNGSRAEMRAQVAALGGKVVREFSNVNALAVTLPVGGMATLQTLPEFKVWRDAQVAPPRPRAPRGVGTGVVKLKAARALELNPQALKGALDKLPADYNFNNALIGAHPLHAAGNLGQNVIVAVIDSGTSMAAFSLEGSVIGGENFVPGGDEPSATSGSNDPHGTWVGTMIAGHAAFALDRNHPGNDPEDREIRCLARSVPKHVPNSSFPGSVFGLSDRFTVIPMIGVAPGAKIYAMKVFSADGGGAPSERIIDAMDRVVTLKKNYLKGVPSVPVSGNGTENHPHVFDSLNIKVVNVSLGGGTLIPAQEIEDELIEKMLKLNIVVSVASGNEGPSGLTTGSPSTSLAAISSAASTTPQHERVLYDVAFLQDFPGCNAGKLARPNNTIQAWYFSSRGPTSDGRVGVDVISAGNVNFVESANGSIALVSGTSFSAPTVSGAAALLRKAKPSANAGKVRNAIIKGADFKLLGDKSTRFDQGRGYLDIPASLSLLRNNKVGSSYPRHRPHASVKQNLAELGVTTRLLSGNSALNFSASNLLPGQRKELVVEIPKNIASVRVDVTRVTPQLPRSQQNRLFTDDIILAVRQAKTSAFGQCILNAVVPDDFDYPVCEFIGGPASFTIDNPEPGFMRITVLGDWTNVGKVSAALSITGTRRTATPDFKLAGLIGDGEKITIPFNVPANTRRATFELTWLRDWYFYPTNDLDLVLVAPDGEENGDGVTLDGRERAVILNPAAGRWKIEVHGFTVFGVFSHLNRDDSPKFLRKDLFEVQVHLD